MNENEIIVPTTSIGMFTLNETLNRKFQDSMKMLVKLSNKVNLNITSTTLVFFPDKEKVSIEVCTPFQTFHVYPKMVRETIDNDGTIISNLLLTDQDE